MSGSQKLQKMRGEELRGNYIDSTTPVSEIIDSKQEHENTETTQQQHTFVKQIIKEAGIEISDGNITPTIAQKCKYRNIEIMIIAPK